MSFFDKLKRKQKNPQSPSDGLPQSPVSEDLPDEPMPSAAESPLKTLSPEIGTAAHFMAKLMQEDKDALESVMVEGRLLTEALETIQSHLQKISEAEKAISDSEIFSDTPSVENKQKAENESSDAIVKLFTSTDKMTAFLYLLPPIGTGEKPSEALLRQSLSESGIQYGIDEDTLAVLIEREPYYQLHIIARGTPPVTGEDGKIIDHFPRSQQIRLVENQRGSVDHKDLHLFSSVEEGQAICDIIPPSDGTDGHNVMGQALPAPKGKMPVVPKGKNTSISADGSSLISDIKGDLSFQNNVFRVESQLIIPGNVDNSTGNIQFSGDVLIKGDVRIGFKVTAVGNIIIQGIAESATLTAGENIEIMKGMNGNGKSVITAGGSIRSHFLEQATISAEGDVISETIVNCHITSGGSIIASSGKGVIIGGTLSARYHVEAKRIGNLSDARTLIKIGYFMRNDENIDTLTKDLANAKDTLDKITKNCNYLDRLPEIPPNRVELYHTLLEQKGLYEQVVSDLEVKLEQAENRIIDYRKCYVQGDAIYGITEVQLNYDKYVLKDTTHKCKIFFSKKDNCLTLGTF